MKTDVIRGCHRSSCCKWEKIVGLRGQSSERLFRERDTDRDGEIIEKTKDGDKGGSEASACLKMLGCCTVARYGITPCTLYSVSQNMYTYQHFY